MVEEKDLKKGDGDFGTVFSPPAKKKGMAAFCEFLYNPSTNEFLGRTPLSWGKITVFYIIFYACLAALWAVFLLIFLQTIPADQPKWQQESGIIGTNPGVGFRPRPANVDSTLIMFTSGKTEANNKTYQHWVTELDKFVTVYYKGTKEEQGSGQASTDCTSDEAQLDKDKFCPFVVSGDMLGPCNTRNNFGYEQGDPCVFIKLNKIYGWIPEVYNMSDVDAEDSAIPPQLKEEMKRNLRSDGQPQKMVWITCEGENPADKENIGEVEYFPQQGLPLKHFPYYRQSGYLSPFAAVHFKNPNSGVLINIECKAWARNIRHNRMDRIGSVHFELLKD